jgi:DNA helicase-2/ATP-dependent DNA helicase PcrA
MKSRFFDELPDAVLKWLTPQISARRGNLWQGDDDFAAVSRPAYAKAKAAQDSGYRIGQNVAHAKFGAGVIVNSEGSGQDARVQVNFGRNGMKWLALAYAKLDPL